MSIDVIQTSWVRKYSTTLGMQPQQMDSYFINKVYVEPNVGSGLYLFDRINTIGTQVVTERFGDSPHNDLGYQRRGLIVKTYDSGRLIDNKEDTLRAAIAPDSKIAKAQRSALHRDMDDIIIAAMFSPVQTQDANENLGTSNFPTGTNQVAVTEQSGAGVSACGMNVEKLRAAMEILQANEIPDGTEVFCALTPSQIRSLMSDPEMTNADYNALRPLMAGRLTSHYGVNFMKSNRIQQTDSTNYDRIPLWIKEAVRFGFGESAGVTGDIWLRGDKKKKPYLYASFNGGAAREHDEGVVEILCARGVGPVAT